MRKTIVLLISATAILGSWGGLTGCTSVPETGRRSINLVDDKAVQAMSAQAFEDMKKQYRVSRNKRLNDTLLRVGNKIIGAISIWDLPANDWEFVVFEAPGEVNALAMPGGKVAVFSGAFDVANTDDQLAVIIGHEIAHVTAKHVHERLSQQMLAQTGGAVVSILSPVDPLGLTSAAVMSVYQMGSGALGLSFDRKKESEADHVGLIYMARAGYNPRASIELWEKMDQLVSGQAPPAEWLSTHPSHLDRMARLYGWMEEAEAEYQKALKLAQP